MANFNLMATEAVMELQIRDHLVLEGDINEIIEFLAVFGSRPKESSECAEGDINKIIEFLAVVAILSGFEMLQATLLAWSLWVVVPINQASGKYAIANMLLSRSFAFAAALDRRWSMPFTRVSHCCEIWHHTLDRRWKYAIR